jgi:hypothetical protein
VKPVSIVSERTAKKKWLQENDSYGQVFFPANYMGGIV